MDRMKCLSIIEEWTKKDAKSVVKAEHTRDREAGIRLGLIKKILTLSEEGKKWMYYRYCKELTRKIDELNNNKFSWGTYPCYDD